MNDQHDQHDDSKGAIDTIENVNQAAVADNTAQLVALAQEYVPGSKEEKALLWKLDRRILPCVWSLFVLNFLDRSNIGNAKTGGMERDLNMTSNQYSICVLVFFITYLIFEIPSNLILARVRPSLYLPGLCILWGGIAACLGTVQTWQQLAAVRIVLGIAEAGFAPGVIFYLSSWYRRFEISRRFAIYYTAVSIAGALSGLLAGAITENLDGARGIAGWRWLFIIEGVASVGLGCIVWFFMADYPATTRWLTPEERLLAAQRLAYDGLGNTQGAEGNIGEWKAIKLAVTDFRTWILSLLLALILGAQTISYFVPTLMGALGWTGATGQYHTIPVYICGTFFTLLTAWLSDHYKNKPLFIMIGSGLGAIFFILCVAITNPMGRYVAVIFAVGIIYGFFVLAATWGPNVIPAPAQKRAVSIAIINGIGNSASIYGVFIWPKADGPRYVPGFAATTTFMVLVCLTAGGAWYFFNKHPVEMRDPDEVVAAEIQKQREQGVNITDVYMQKKAELEVVDK